MWRLNFYQEMVAIDLHYSFPYDAYSKKLTKIMEETLFNIMLTGTDKEKVREKADDLKKRMLAKICLV